MVKQTLAEQLSLALEEVTLPLGALGLLACPDQLASQEMSVPLVASCYLALAALYPVQIPPPHWCQLTRFVPALLFALLLLRSVHFLFL